MGLDTFLGNAGAVKTIRELLAGHRVPSALLFTGPDGVGKKTLALMLAKALNCDHPSSGPDDFCGECPPCLKAEQMIATAREDLARRRELKDAQRRVEGLVYFDIQLIEPLTRYILIDQVRAARHVAYTHPFELRHRVFILDQAQAIHWQAVDLLLKVLEEPPLTTHLILVCRNAAELRPTIRSRCFPVQFLPLDERVIAEMLAEQKQLSKSQRALAVRVAAGSVARAKSLDLTDYERRRRPWLDFLESVAGKGPDHAPDWKMLFDSTKALAEDRENFEETLRIGYSLLRDLLIIHSNGADNDLVNVDLLPKLKAWSTRLAVSHIERLKGGMDQAYRSQVRNINQQLGLDALAIEFLASRLPEDP